MHVDADIFRHFTAVEMAYLLRDLAEILPINC